MKKVFKIKTKDSAQDFINIEKTIKKYWKGSGAVNVAPFSKVFVVKPTDVTDIDALEKELTGMGYKIQRNGETRLVSYKDSKTVSLYSRDSETKDADPTYRSVWLKVKEYVKYHYNFNYKNDFRGLMDFLNNQYGGSIDEDSVYDILRDLNSKGYIIFTKDSKMKDYQSYVGYAGAEKLKQDIKNYNGTPEVFSYFLKPKEPSSIQLMGAIINKKDFYLTMVMKNVTYKGDLNGAKKDALKAVDDIVKTWKSLSYEDSAVKDAVIDKNKIEQIISSREFNFVKENGNTQTYKFIGQNPYDKEYHFKELSKALPNNVGLALSGDILTVSFRDNAIKDAKKLWEVMSRYGIKQYSADNEMDAVKQYMKDYPKATEDDITIRLIKQISSWNHSAQLASENIDSAIKDYKPNVYKSSSYRIIEKLPNGNGVAQTYGDGLFYVFDKNGDVIDYPSYAFKTNAVEAAKRMKDNAIKDDTTSDILARIKELNSGDQIVVKGYRIYNDGKGGVLFGHTNSDMKRTNNLELLAQKLNALKDTKTTDAGENRIFELGNKRQVVFSTGNFVAMENGVVYDKGFLGGSKYNNGKGWNVDDYIKHLKSLGYKEVNDSAIKDASKDLYCIYYEAGGTTGFTEQYMTDREFNNLKSKGILTGYGVITRIDRQINGKYVKVFSDSSIKDATPITVESVVYKEGDTVVLEYTYNGRKMWIVTSNYKGEKTYNGGGTIEFTKEAAIQTAKDFALIHRLQKKYGTTEGNKRYLAGYKDENPFEKGQAYYYARTGNKVDINGEVFIINEDAGKIGYTDVIGLTNVKTGRHTQISKQEFIKEARLLKDASPIKLLGAKLEFVEGKHSTYGVKSLVSIDAMNKWLVTEDAKVREEHAQGAGFGGYDKAYVDLIFDVNGKHYRVHGLRANLGDGEDAVKIESRDIDYCKGKLEKVLAGGSDYTVKQGDRKIKK